jgi:hypothetical protein
MDSRTGKHEAPKAEVSLSAIELFWLLLINNVAAAMASGVGQRLLASDVLEKIASFNWPEGPIAALFLVGATFYGARAIARKIRSRLSKTRHKSVAASSLRPPARGLAPSADSELIILLKLLAVQAKLHEISQAQPFAASELELLAQFDGLAAQRRRDIQDRGRPHPMKRAVRAPQT